MKYEKLSKEIILKVGGKDNIEKVIHCATRLRFTLRDESIAETASLKKTEGIFQVVQSGGQYQIIVGPHVSDVFKEINNILVSGDSQGEKIESKSNEKISTKKKTVLSVVLDVFITVMGPLIGVLSAIGILKGFLALSLSLGWLTRDSGTYTLLYALADSVMYFFPIILGHSAAKKFDLNIYTGMALGATLVYPSVGGLLGNKPLYTIFTGTLFESSVYTTLFGIPVLLMNYSSTMIPIIVACFIASRIEKSVKKIVPQIIGTFGIPLMTLMIIVPISFLLIGPITVLISQAIGKIILMTYNLSPTFVSALLGGLWLPLVLFGIHGAVVPIALTNFFTMGSDVILPMITGHSFAAAGIVLGIVLKTKNIKIKEVGIPAVLSGFLVGVTEPALYGVLLKARKFFIITCILSAIGGGVIGFNRVQLHQLSGQGIFAIPSFIKVGNVGAPIELIVIVAVMLITFVISIILGYLLYNDNQDTDLARM